ncbi:MAG: carbohydrate ABC transporter permease [Eubacteriales bacterium]|nr:carbohydrate ABC transporter permease [Eubacteriales bacterium]
MKRKTRKAVLPYIILAILAFIFALPLVWLLLSALDPGASQSFTVPDRLSLANFREVWTNARNLRGFLNSLFISVIQTTIVMICSLLAAYPLSRYALKAGQKISMGLLFLTSIPITAVMVPVYQMFISMELVDSVWGVILFLSASALPYGIWMTKNFMDAVPVELEEAAWIDGASSLQSIRKVVLPLILPGVFTVTIFTFVGSWGNFFVPFILLQSTEKMTASINIYHYFGEQGVIMYGQLAAYSLSYITPSLLLYFFAQNYMSKGFSMVGGTKG